MIDLILLPSHFPPCRGYWNFVVAQSLSKQSVRACAGRDVSPLNRYEYKYNKQSRSQSPRYLYLAARFPFRWTRVTRALGTRLYDKYFLYINKVIASRHRQKPFSMFPLIYTNTNTQIYHTPFFFEVASKILGRLRQHVVILLITVSARSNISKCYFLFLFPFVSTCPSPASIGSFLSACGSYFVLKCAMNVIPVIVSNSVINKQDYSGNEKKPAKRNNRRRGRNLTSNNEVGNSTTRKGSNDYHE